MSDPVFRTGFENPGIPADLASLRAPPSLDKPRGPVRSALVFPPWERPVATALDFQPIGQGLALAGVAGATVSCVQQEIPNGYSYVVRGVNIFVLNPTAAFDVDYVVTFNGTPIFNQPLKTFGRAAQSLEVPFSFAKRGIGPGFLEVVAQNNNANAWTVGAQITGWLWPTPDGLRAYGEDR